MVVLRKGDGESEEFRTSVKDADLNPAFGESFNMNLTGVDFMGGEHGARLQFKVWDSNAMSDSLMGSAAMPLCKIVDGVQRLTLNGPRSDVNYGTLQFTARRKTVSEKQTSEREAEERTLRQKQELDELAKTKEFMQLELEQRTMSEDGVDHSIVFTATLQRGSDGTKVTLGEQDQPGRLQRLEFEIDAAQRRPGPLESTVLIQAWKVTQRELLQYNHN